MTRFPSLLRALAVASPLLTLAACGGGEEARAGAGATDASPEASASAQTGGADGSAARSTAGARLIFEEQTVRLGEVRQRETRLAVFPFRVEGEGPVTVDSVRHSCGCTNSWIRPDWAGAEEGDGAEAAWPEGKPIPAGAEGAVIAEFRTDTKVGRMPVSITLRGDMAQSPAVLELIADVVPFFVVEPDKVLFGDVLAAGLRTEDPTVDVSVAGPRPWRVTRWTRLPQGVAVEPVGGAATDDLGATLQRFRFRITDDARAKVIDGYAEAETSLDVPLRLKVAGQVTGPVRYAPSHRLVFGVWAAGEARTRNVLIEPTQDGISLPRPEIALTGEAADRVEHALTRMDGGGWKVALSVPADAPTGSCSGTLDVRWPADAGFDDQKILVTGLLRGSP